MTADEIIATLGMQAHPEGGWYVELWRGPENPRAAYSSIYFLLKAGERSHWHRVDAAEIWHYHAGAPLRLRRAETDAGPVEDLVLGANLAEGERPQHLIRPGEWQAAETLGDWTLVGCTVAPGFEFAGFELAEPGFTIPR
ncbi:MAG: cupin domain-containing protein [Pseudomonadota bacterium]